MRTIKSPKEKNGEVPDDGHLGNEPIIDGFNRPITSLRLSINRECNLDCFYCHSEGMLLEKRDMTIDEIYRLVSIASKLGIKRLKLTGGEPLLRSDVVDIIQKISPLMKDVSLTTNAVKLAGMAKQLKSAGLDRINVSLHTINHETYKRICGSDNLDDALKGLDTAIDAKLQPIKINMVILKGINDQEISEMLKFASEKGVILQLIELETEREYVDQKIYVDHFQDLKQIRTWLQNDGKTNGANPLHRREKFIIEELPGKIKLGSPVEVELVMPMHNSDFCSNCTRIRLTAGGFVKG
jgi:cyclic pyranopterin phosphate synthase